MNPHLPESDRVGGLRPVVGMLLIWNRRLLLGKRVGKDTKDPHYQLTWDIPQGGIEPRETAQQTIEREIGEELGAEWLAVIGNPTLFTRVELRFPLEKDGQLFLGKAYYYHVVPIENPALLAPTPEFSGGVIFCTYEEARKHIEETQRGKKGRMLLGVLDKLKNGGLIE